MSRVVKTFGGLPAVDGIDLSVEDGATTVLIGPSGCGKSTILRMLNGLIEPDSGEIRWHGAPLGQTGLARVRQHQGYVIQEGGLFPHLTARENLELLVRYLGWEADRVEARTHELTGLARLPEGTLDRYPRQLSGGQRQRISLMRALMPDPDVLLLDEPLAALDPMIRADLQSDLQQIFADLKKTVVLVTHDLAEADHFADLIVLLRKGKIVQQGSMDDLFSRPADAFVTRFIEAQRQLTIRS